MRPSLGTHRKQLRLEADAVVLDTENEIGAGYGEVDADPMGSSMLANVGQRLASDAEHLGLGRSR
jgi:hypothetical protein